LGELPILGASYFNHELAISDFNYWPLIMKTVMSVVIPSGSIRRWWNCWSFPKITVEFQILYL